MQLKIRSFNPSWKEHHPMGDTRKEGGKVNVFVCVSCCLLSLVPLEIMGIYGCLILKILQNQITTQC
jgi:hypothetical protein